MKLINIIKQLINVRDFNTLMVIDSNFQRKLINALTFRLEKLPVPKSRQTDRKNLESDFSSRLIY